MDKPSQLAWQLQIKCELGLVSLADLKTWATEQLGETEVLSERSLLSDLVEIRSVGDLVPNPLRRLVSLRYPDFVVTSRVGENLARDLWVARLNEYASGLIGPNDICGTMQLIETCFDYPDWLGNMYNACDWVDTQDQADARQVGEEVDRLLTSLGTA